MLVFLLAAVPAAWSADWPQFRCDAGRTATSPERLPDRLRPIWTRRLPRPQPAFPNEVRLRYDVVYEPVVSGKTIFVPSMVTDTVTALDTETGAERWHFFAEGPVRFAPVVNRDKVYFVSDDGYLYCLDAASGDLCWRFRGLPPDREDRKLLGNERLISLSPARGGPVLADGRIYFAAGLWPAYGAFVHALDAQTGEVVWSNLASHRIPEANMDHGIAQYAGLTPQGYLAIVGNKLVVPCGAQLPALLDLETGELDTYCMGWGGRVALPKGSWFVAGTGNFLSHSGDLYDISKRNEERFRDPRGARDFKKELYAGALQRVMIDPTNQRALGSFQEPVLSPDTLILNNGGLVAYDLQSGKLQPRDISQVPAYRTADQYPDHLEMQFTERWRFPTKAQVQIATESAVVVSGPGSVQLIGIPAAGEAAEIVWQTQIDGTPHRVLAADSKLFVVTREGGLHAFGDSDTPEPAVHVQPASTPPAADSWTKLAATILEQTQVAEGYAVVLGLDNGRLVEELLRQSDMTVIAIDADAQRVSELREQLHQSGLYGTRASVHVGDPLTYALPPYLADLVVSEKWDAVRPAWDPVLARTVTRLLRPFGGTAWISNSESDADQVQVVVDRLDDRPLSVRQSGHAVLVARNGPLPGTDDWSHPSANAANTGATGDSFVKAPLELLWFNGARRWPRKPGSAEVRVADGRVLVKAGTLHASDVYTGRSLWETRLPFPHSPTDQIVVGTDGIYVTGGRICVILNPATGEVTDRIELPADLPGPWLNLRVSGDRLVAQSGKILFCIDRRSGKPVWQHPCERSNMSIAVGNGRVFCAELVNKRRGEKDQDGRTRAVDLATGKQLWEIAGGSRLGYSQAHDLLVTSGGIYRGQDGSLVAATADFDTLHGNQPCDLLSIIGDQVLWGTVTSYSAYNLATGESLGDPMVWVRRGCTGLRASTNLVTTRHRANCAYIDVASREITSLWNVRPGCNNNLFPANGILNIPNLTGGCECNYTPTSQAYVPRSVLGAGE